MVILSCLNCHKQRPKLLECSCRRPNQG